MTLHDYNDALVIIPLSSVLTVEDQPRGQTMITLTNGTIMQVKESIEKVLQLMEEERTR
jgi:uncharacterized protein YlzI (FlbEa/FlbD family)